MNCVTKRIAAVAAALAVAGTGTVSPAFAESMQSQWRFGAQRTAEAQCDAKSRPGGGIKIMRCYNYRIKCVWAGVPWSHSVGDCRWSWAMANIYGGWPKAACYSYGRFQIQRPLSAGEPRCDLVVG